MGYLAGRPAWKDNNKVPIGCHARSALLGKMTTASMHEQLGRARGLMKPHSDTCHENPSPGRDLATVLVKNPMLNFITSDNDVTTDRYHESYTTSCRGSLMPAVFRVSTNRGS